VALDFHVGTPRDSGLQRKLGDMLARNLAASDMLGRLQIARHAHKKTGKLLPIAAGRRALRFDENDDSSSQDVTAGFSFDLPDEQTARIIGALTPVTREIFDGLTAQYRKDAFTLAGTSDVRLIRGVLAALAEIGEKGGTASDFHDAVQKLTTEAGAADLNSFTLDTAFNTAMQKAYSAGRLEQMSEPHMIDALPFWQYWTVGDDRVRPEHAVLDGFLARAIDPVWRKIYPPSGFNCRCSVVPIPEEEALKLDPKASEGGLERLPMLARIFVPQPGFFTLLHAA
jgi:SPP1 gp7 family putative phage head morphogenesis protein